MKKKIIVFGVGDLAQICNYYFEIDSKYTVEAFTVDSQYLTSDFFENKPVIPFDRINKEYPPEKYLIFLSMGYKNLNKLRAEKYDQIKKMGYSFVSYVSSRCSYLSQSPPGDNCFIFEDNTIQPFVHIGNNVTLWSGNHIGHHSTIEDHNFISSHVVISGHCHIEPFCFFGVNSCVHNNIKISSESLIGAGAVISKNTVKKGVYLPAKSELFPKRSNEINF